MSSDDEEEDSGDEGLAHVDDEDVVGIGDVDDMILDDGGDGGWDIFGTNILDASGSRTSGFWRSLSKEYVKRQVSISAKSSFQKEISYNRLLPYYDKLAREADEQLCSIKAGLGRAVLLREVRPALLHWACELDKYIYLHGYRFSKEDHLKFVHLFYEMVINPEMELRLVKTFAHVLEVLLRKKELLSRDDLVLDWRPLCKLFEFVTYKSSSGFGYLLIPQGISNTLDEVARAARTYFSVDATQEILDYARPWMCPWDMAFFRAIHILSLFLPTEMPPSQHDRGFRLWLDEIVHWWLLIQNFPVWEPLLVRLMTRVSLNNIGYIDWNPYLPEIFTKILRSFGLSISGRLSETIDVGQDEKIIDAATVAIWVASMYGGNSQAPTYVQNLFEAVESYLHPSNSGNWQSKILDFMERLALSICQRVQKERHRKSDWKKDIPDSTKLTDQDIEAFVKSLLPCALNGVFAKGSSYMTAVSTLHCLSHLCPNLVVPAVLEKLYPALTSLTEPHRLTQTMRSLLGVILPLVRETATRHHVIPLMNAILPGLDPSDSRKSMDTCQVLSLIAILVPFVDCSDAVHMREDLTDEEKELCSATATFDSYINLFMDRILALVDTFAGGATSGTPRGQGASEELDLEGAIIQSSVFSAYRALLSNSSTELYKVAVNRLFSYLEDRSLEGKLMADMMGEMCYSAVRTILEDTFDEEEVDDTIIWHLVILSKLVSCEGNVLTEHRPKLIELLKTVLRLKAKEAYSAAAKIIENLLTSLSTLYTCQHDQDRALIDRSLDQNLPIRHWAEPYDRNSLNLNWHIPNADEINFVKELLTLSVADQLKIFEHPQNLTKESMLRSLNYIFSGIAGAGSVLPLIESNKCVNVVESQVPFSRFKYVTNPNETAIDWEGKNVRQIVYDSLHRLMEYLLVERENETQALLEIMGIYLSLLFHRGLYKTKFMYQRSGLRTSKQLIGHKVLGKKANLKSLIADLVLIQHHKRQLEKSGYSITETHFNVMKDLLKLSTSSYSEIRGNAQQCLDHCFSCFPYSYQLLLDDILALLQPDEKITHEQFKGALYVLLGNRSRSLMTRHDWKSLSKVWPAVIKAQHSEKPSIIALLDALEQTLANFESFQIQLRLSDDLIAAAKNLWNNEDAFVPSLPTTNEDTELSEIVKNVMVLGRRHPPSSPMPSEKELEAAVSRELETSKNNLKLYYDFVDQLVQLCNDTSLHWRHTQMAISLVGALPRMDTVFPSKGIEVLVRFMTHESPIRNHAILCVAENLKIHKRPTKKLTCKTNELIRKATNKDNNIGSKTAWPVQWGFRFDNDWFAYKKAKAPKSAEDREETIFLDRTESGFYCWPQEITYYAPPSQQPKIDRSRDELSPQELPLYDALNDQAFVEKLFQQLSMEKDEDESFSKRSFLFFSNTFRTYGDTFLEKFRPLVEKLCESKKPPEQRLASEFVSGLLRGSKLWPYEKHETIRKWLTPILESVLDNLTQETFLNWSTCLATAFQDRDPRRFPWLIDILLKLARKPMDGCFNMASRFCVFHSALLQMEWRVLEVWQEFYEIIEPQLAQPYQTLRGRFGTGLDSIFTFDIPYIHVDESVTAKPPKRAAFLKNMKTKLHLLWAEMEKGVPDEVSLGVDLVSKSAERTDAILLLKTIVSYFETHWSDSMVSAPPEIMEFLPLLCYFENETTDDELKDACHSQLMQGMARALIYRSDAQLLFDIVVKASANKWWKARVSTLLFLRVALFSNLFYFWTDNFKKQILTLLSQFLHDPQLEVREAASETLGGLLHCRFIPADSDLRKKFKDWTLSKTPLTRHAGVLGLAAVVKSCPYTVPDYLPDMLMALCPHVNDKQQPVQATVKKTLQEFKRTHYDSWHEHKEFFTDDQLAILTDLLVSPNYYV